MTKKISLVLSGGSARGIAHIGVIEVLVEQGYKIVSIAGTSMGALVGSAYALGKLDEFKEWLFRLDRKKVFSLIDFTLSSQGLIKGDRVLGELKKIFPDKPIEALPIPLALVATDVLNKREIVFTEGSVYEAIRASIAIPTVFTPVKVSDGLLVDGGVINNIPVNRVKRFPGDILVVVDVGAEIPPIKTKQVSGMSAEKESRYRARINEFTSHLKKMLPSGGEERLGYFNLINKTINCMTYHLTRRILEECKPDILIEISKDSCGTFDFFKAEEMVEIGRYAASKSFSLS